jgi:transcriptional regulator with XRE-family HTH domain
MEQNPRQAQALTPSQIVAFNLRRIRKARGWTQERAAEALLPYLGVRWSSAQFSVAERWDPRPGQKARQFGVDDLIALAAGFRVYLSELLTPPKGTDIALPGGGLEASAIQALTGETANRQVIGDLASRLTELLQELGRVEEGSSITIHPEGHVTLKKVGS